MKWLYEHSLSIVLFALFFIFLAGQSIAGYQYYNDEQVTHQSETLSYPEYVVSGNFIESVFENWESEFLQMASYVVLTVFLLQKGSSESKKLQGREPVDAVAQETKSKSAAWPLRAGGLWKKLYEHSLSLALLLLFVLSFALHAYGGAIETSEENLAHGEQPIGTLQYISTSRFWFESFQNWQSEFLAVGALVVLTVYLREIGSPESKPVSTPHDKTGSE